MVYDLKYVTALSLQEINSWLNNHPVSETLTFNYLGLAEYTSGKALESIRLTEKGEWLKIAIEAYQRVSSLEEKPSQSIKLSEIYIWARLAMIQDRIGENNEKAFSIINKWLSDGLPNAMALNLMIKNPSEIEVIKKLRSVKQKLNLVAFLLDGGISSIPSEILKILPLREQIP